jgi:hypothetical protein
MNSFIMIGDGKKNTINGLAGQKGQRIDNKEILQRRALE